MFMYNTYIFLFLKNVYPWNCLFGHLKSAPESERLVDFIYIIS